MGGRSKTPHKGKRKAILLGAIALFAMIVVAIVVYSLFVSAYYITLIGLVVSAALILGFDRVRKKEIRLADP